MTQPVTRPDGTPPTRPNLERNWREFSAAGLAFLAFCFSFSPYEGVSLMGESFGFNAWHNVLSVFAVLISLAVGGGALVLLLGTPLPFAKPWSVLARIANVAGLLLLIRFFWILGSGGDGWGPQWGIYVGMVILIAQIYLLYTLARRAGEPKRPPAGSA